MGETRDIPVGEPMTAHAHAFPDNLTAEVPTASEGKQHSADTG